MMRWRRDSASLWLLYLVLFYPCWWLAQGLVTAAPQLLRSTIVGGPPPRITLSAFGFSSEAGLSTEPLAWTIVVATIAWLACLAVAWRLRALRPVAILAAAWIAYALLGRGLFAMLLFSQFHLIGLVAAAAGFAALVFTLSRLPIAASALTPWQRIATLSGVFLLPLVVGHLPPLLFVDGFRLFGLYQILLLVLAAIVLAAIWRGRDRGATS